VRCTRDCLSLLWEQKQTRTSGVGGGRSILLMDSWGRGGGRSPVLADHSFGVALELQNFGDMLLLRVSVTLEGADPVCSS